MGDLLFAAFLDRGKERGTQEISLVAQRGGPVVKVRNSSTGVPEKLRYYFSEFSKVYKMNSQISLLCQIRSSVDQKVFEIQFVSNKL